MPVNYCCHGRQLYYHGRATTWVLSPLAIDSAKEQRHLVRGTSNHLVRQAAYSTIVGDFHDEADFLRVKASLKNKKIGTTLSISFGSKKISTRTPRDFFRECGATLPHDPNQFVWAKLQRFPACRKGSQRTVARDSGASGGGPETGGGSKGRDRCPKRINPVQEVMMQVRMTPRAEQRRQDDERLSEHELNDVVGNACFSV